MNISFQFRNILLAILCIFSFSKGNAQIIYVDPNPDTTILMSVMDMDIDSNGTNEFHFSSDLVMLSANDWVYRLDLTPQASSIAQMNAVVSSGLSPIILNSGDLICDTSQWSHGFQQMGGCQYPVTGNWSVSGFLGIRFNINNQAHYGWIRFSATCNSIILRNWAYNSQADSSILAGEGWLAGIQSQNAALFANVTTINHSILVDLDENSEATISVYDCSGKLINKTENAKGEIKIDLENINTGIYFIEVAEGDKFYSKKIYLQ